MRTFLTLATALASAGSLQGAAIIYEPFAVDTGNLSGAAGGSGLTGNWTASRVSVVADSLPYGALPTSGNSASQDGTTRLGSANITVGSELSNAGLLDDGAELWFSYLFRTPVAGTNDAFEFVLSSEGPVSFNSGLPNSGTGIGTHLQSGNSIRASSWNSTRNASPSGGAITTNTIALVVGKISWGATGTDADTIEVFLPGLDLQLPASSVSTTSVVLAQSTFDTLTFSAKDDAPDLDEIRFGASYADVVPVPEPSIVLLGGLGLLGLLRRRT